MHIAQFTDALATRPLWMRAVNSVAALEGSLLRHSADAWWEAAPEAEPVAAEPAPEACRALGALVEPLREETRINFIGKLAARDDTIRMAVRSRSLGAAILPERPVVASEMSAGAPL